MRRSAEPWQHALAEKLDLTAAIADDRHDNAAQTLRGQRGKPGGHLVGGPRDHGGVGQCGVVVGSDGKLSGRHGATNRPERETEISPERRKRGFAIVADRARDPSAEHELVQRAPGLLARPTSISRSA